EGERRLFDRPGTARQLERTLDARSGRRPQVLRRVVRLGQRRIHGYGRIWRISVLGFRRRAHRRRLWRHAGRFCRLALLCPSAVDLAGCRGSESRRRNGLGRSARSARRRPHHHRQRSAGRRIRPGRQTVRRRTMANKITTCLWFDKGEARKAGEIYAPVFPDSKVGPAHEAASDFPGGEKGEELTVEFTVLGQSFLGLNGGPNFKPNEAGILVDLRDDPEDTDRYWDAITKNGGEESMCGWGQ